MPQILDRWSTDAIRTEEHDDVTTRTTNDGLEVDPRQNSDWLRSPPVHFRLGLDQRLDAAQAAQLTISC